MPAAADRLIAPSTDRRPRPTAAVVLAAGLSLIAHAAAVAAAISTWSDGGQAPPRPIEVVMITVAQPGPAPAPALAEHAPAPAAERTSPPPAIPAPAVPAPAVPAPSSMKADTPPPAAHRIPVMLPRVQADTPRPATVARVATAPLPPAQSDAAIATAVVERVAEPADTAAPAAAVPTPTHRPAGIGAAPAPAAASWAPPTAAPSRAAPSRAASPRAAPAPSTGQAAAPASFQLGSAGNPAPEYPHRARQKGWQGRVVLHVLVDSGGHPVTVAVERSSGHGVLDDAAYRTVARWVFRPAIRDGRPVAGEAVVPVVFRLD